MSLKSIYLGFQDHPVPEPMEVWERDGHLYPVKRREDGKGLFIAGANYPYITNYKEESIRTIPGAPTGSWDEVRDYVKTYGEFLAYYSLSGGYWLSISGPECRNEFATALKYPDYGDFVEKFEKLNTMSGIKFMAVLGFLREKKGRTTTYEPQPPAIMVTHAMFAEDYRDELLQSGVNEWKAREMVKQYHKTHTLDDMILDRCGQDVLDFLKEFRTVDFRKYPGD